MRTFIAWALAAIVCTLLVITGIQIAYADDLVAAPSPSFLVDLWEVVQPLAALFVSTVGPALVTWIAYRLVSLLQIKDENEKKALEAKTRDALHQSAMNGLKAALARAGYTQVFGPLPQSILAEAIEYVKTKNPDTIEQAGASLEDVGDIVLSKVPDLSAPKPLGA